MNSQLTIAIAVSTSLLAAAIRPAVTLAADVAATDVAAAASEPAAAAASPDSPDSPDSALESVIVTGTRAENVKARDSVAPIDVLPATALEATGATDLRD